MLFMIVLLKKKKNYKMAHLQAHEVYTDVSIDCV